MNSKKDKHDKKIENNIYLLIHYIITLIYVYDIII